jgi:adenylate cyclase
VAFEIERKFLVKGDSWRRQLGRVSRLRQGYLFTNEKGAPAEVRVRRTESQAFLTIKGKGNLVRAEYEYEIPSKDADEMLTALCGGGLIEKIRHEVEYDGMTWSIDEFLGANRGLLLAEVEMKDQDQSITLPDWVGAEVTDDAQYKNANLAAAATGRR